jgi:hypothetical protein
MYTRATTKPSRFRERSRRVSRCFAVCSASHPKILSSSRSGSATNRPVGQPTRSYLELSCSLGTLDRSFQCPGAGLARQPSKRSFAWCLAAAHRLRRRPQRLVRHRRVPSHHPLRFPAAEGHHDRRREAPVKRHRRPMMAEVVKVEVSEPACAGRLAEHPADVGTFVRAASRPLGTPIRSHAPRAGRGGSSVPRRSG